MFFFYYKKMQMCIFNDIHRLSCNDTGKKFILTPI